MSRNERWLRKLITDDALASSVAARLEAKLDKTSSPTGCWLFTAKSRSAFGYGLMFIGRDGKTSGNGNSPTHRIAYVLHNKKMPPDGQFVCHACDNPPCCNPAHLFVGTHLDNMADMRSKKRSPDKAGEKASLAIYTSAQVLDVVRLAREGKSSTEIQALLGVDKMFVSRVRSGVAWTSVTGLKRGELNSKHKLTEDDVIAIRKLYADGAQLDELAERFCVSASNISMIVRFKTWKKVA